MSARTLFLKDPDAVLDYEFDWTAWLTGGETVTGHTISVDGVTFVESTASTTSVVAWVSEGTAGTFASITCQIVTSASRVDERTITLEVTDR